ncbi:restriction endonuclease subunit S [Acinetobacter wanghuae]|nr:restriction endonuclease subunit S [Acinetobacter wanghuae]
MQFKPYPLYIPCDIHWFNEIPQSWKQVRVEQYLIKKDENIGDLWDSTQLLSLTQNGIIEKDINDGKGKTHSDYSTYQAIDIGDLVFCLFDIDETPRTIGLSTKQGMITSAYTAFKSKKNINTQYLYYFFESLDDAKALKPYYKGLRKTVRPPEFLKIHVPFPPKVEQDVISQFLDTETSRIDNLIAKQEKLIELLEEQRKSIISYTVTKGLDPNAPMKDSNVEWLGEVPEHWDVKNYRFASKIYRGKFGHRPRNDPSLYDGEYPFIQTGDVARAGKYIQTYSQTLNEKGKAVSQVFTSGTLVMAIAANIGDTAILNFEAYAPDSVVGFKPHKNIDLEFLRFSFIASLQALKQTAVQSTQANLNVERIGALKTTFPPLSEQIEISNYLNAENEKINHLISKQNQLIGKLKEYRSSIISHAVTGKIDVREFSA